MTDLAPFSIYTMLHSNRLQQECARGGQHELREGKRWVTGEHLFDEARRAKLRMPLIFSAAEAESGVIYWAVIDDIAVDSETTCRYSDVREVTPARPLSSLRLRSTGRAMSDENIRPYAICHTPDYVR